VIGADPLHQRGEVGEAGGAVLENVVDDALAQEHLAQLFVEPAGKDDGRQLGRQRKVDDLAIGRIRQRQVDKGDHRFDVGTGQQLASFGERGRRQHLKPVNLVELAPDHALEERGVFDK
jgi:hypothetical protein